MKGYCIVCGRDIELTMCCSGRDCGCMGQPVDPPVCDEKCYVELMANIRKYYPQKTILTYTPLNHKENNSKNTEIPFL